MCRRPCDFSTKGEYITAGGRPAGVPYGRPEERHGEMLGKRTMENLNGPALSASRRAGYRLLRVIHHLLRASGIPERTVRSINEQLYRQYARTRARGVWLDCARFLELAQALEMWSRDPEFIDETGAPRGLRLAGGAHPRPGSFPYLLRKSGVSLGARSALAQLRALGAVRRYHRGRRVRLVSDVLLGVRADGFLAPPMLDAIRRCAETVEYNVCRRPSDGARLMHRWVGCLSVDPRRLPEVHRFIRSSGQALLDAVGEKLHTSARKPGNAAKGRLAFGVGLYVYIDRPRRASGRLSGERWASG
jgi:hypothetical protein